MLQLIIIVIKYGDTVGVTRVKDEEKGKKIKAAKPAGPKKKEIRTLIRVVNTDLDGEKQLIIALTGIKGMGHVMAGAICSVARFDPKVKLGSLKEPDIQKIEKIINDPIKFGVPTFLFNRKKDVRTGKDMHFVAADLEMTTKFDVQRMIDIKSYKGVRHMLGLPARGQRTRSSFRKGKSVGVVRKGVKSAMKEGKKKK